MLQPATLADLPAFLCAHAEDARAGTGCTVFIAPDGATCGVDVRGGGPATRETDLLKPENMIQAVHGVVLSGGSAFGLDAAGGVQRYLEERGIGFDTGVAKVPLVSQSCLFDLGVGSKEVRPTADMAYQACENASRSAPALGNVGAGTGCSIGKYRGIDRAMKSGFGTFALQAGPVKVGALVAVNALGDVYSPDGKVVAGLLDKKKSGLSCTLDELFSDASPTGNLFTGNTTLGVIVTNAQFSKTPLTKIAGMAHNGYARAIRPVHTTADGDSIYALSVGSVPGDVNLVGALAAQAMEMAILRAVQTAKSAYGLIGLSDLSH